MSDRYDWVQALREEIIESAEREYVGSIAEKVLREHFHSKERISPLDPKDFFFAATAKVFYADLGETNPLIVNYISELIGAQTLKSDSILKEKDLVLYEKMHKNISLDDMYPDANRAIGDLCLFNSGILRRHHNSEYMILMRKWFFDGKRKETFREVLTEIGVASYKKALVFEEDEGKKEILESMHGNFKDYSEGLNTLAYSYVYSKVI